MKVTERQNIMDVTLQAYGSINQLAWLCYENDINLDETPITGSDIIVSTGLGDKRVQQFTSENDHIYNNNAVEATAALLAAEDTALSPETDVIFIYK